MGQTTESTGNVIVDDILDVIDRHLMKWETPSPRDAAAQACLEAIAMVAGTLLAAFPSHHQARFDSHVDQTKTNVLAEMRAARR